MTNIRRYYRDCYTYFVTNVTIQRLPILRENENMLLESIEKHKAATSSDLMAWAILPDHFHLLVHPSQTNISLLLRKIKLSFSTRYRKQRDLQFGRVWQYRFWDHIIRDQDDMNRHIDYIHRNPVKHGIVKSPFDYPYSSIHQYREFYPVDWGVKEKDDDFEYGE
jgi:putative transposase